MSGDFLTRWSRRKRHAGEAEQTKSAPGEHHSIPEQATPMEPAPAIEGAAPPEPVFDLKTLPPIESITAATDIRPFLAPGVPVDIARAALRRAWSTDPRIRDFVGLADYDWDYHTPGSAGGFGPLEMTDELRRMVARIVGDVVDTDMPEKARKPATGAECVEKTQPPGAKANPPGAPREEIQPAEFQSKHKGSPTFDTTASAALQHANPQDDVTHSAERRRHGSALPK
jgi:Protein of unknown function (DUF3306)